VAPRCSWVSCTSFGICWNLLWVHLVVSVSSPVFFNLFSWDSSTCFCYHSSDLKMWGFIPCTVHQIL
jgi:hypothetical protein